MLKVYHKVAHGTMQAGDMGARAIGSQCETGYRRRRDHSRHLGSRIALTGQFIDGDDALACGTNSDHLYSMRVACCKRPLQAIPAISHHKLVLGESPTISLD